MTRVTFAGHTFDGGDTPGDDLLESLEGWFDGTEVRSETLARQQAHGDFEVSSWHGGRIVSAVVSRRCYSDAEAGTTRREFAALLAGGGFDDLTVVEADGHTTSARVRLNGRTLVRWFPHSQRVRAVVGLYAPDPLRYADAVNVTTSFATQAGGLAFPLFTDGTTDTGFLEFGEQGSTGRASLPVQDGTAPGHTQFLVTGPVPPFTIVRVETGRRVSFGRAVAAGDTLLIDTATGSALLNGGDVDYSGLLTSWEWDPVNPGEAATFAFLPDGAADSGSLTVIHRAAWW